MISSEQYVTCTGTKNELVVYQCYFSITETEIIGFSNILNSFLVHLFLFSSFHFILVLV